MQKRNSLLLRLASAVVLLLTSAGVTAQELYVFTEPASNMPAHSISTKLTTRFTDQNRVGRTFQRYSPEVMFGLSRKWMLHIGGSLSNVYTPHVAFESFRTYAKYRFYSDDDIHKHFRMAAFAEASASRSGYTFHDMNLEGDNTGVLGGIIATQLVGKLAVSGTAYYMALAPEKIVHTSKPEMTTSVLGYSLSAGLLVLPIEYTSYEQTNLNLYVELLGSKGLNRSRSSMIDIAPAMQLIFHSNTKLNIGTRFQLNGSVGRVGQRSLYVGMERTFLNALGKGRKGSKSLK